MTKEVGFDEWKSEIEKYLFKAGDDGVTTKELSEQMGISVSAVRLRLQALKTAGLVRAGRAYRTAVDDIRRMCSVYVLVKKKGKA